jgi:hypothetical protein
MDELIENKVLKVLEHYLSFHEADEIFYRIFNDDNTSIEDIEKRLIEFENDEL